MPMLPSRPRGPRAYRERRAGMTPPPCHLTLLCLPALPCPSVLPCPLVLLCHPEHREGSAPRRICPTKAIPLHCHPERSEGSSPRMIPRRRVRRRAAQATARTAVRRPFPTRRRHPSGLPVADRLVGLHGHPATESMQPAAQHRESRHGTLAPHAEGGVSKGHDDEDPDHD